MKRNELVDSLRTGIKVVTFTKRNGDTRRMICTLQESFLPEVFGQTADKDEIVTVWDVEKNAWRSFRMDSITNIQ